MVSFGVNSIRAIIKGTCAAVLILTVGGFLTGCGEDQAPLPEEKAEAVVKKFYEYISEAKIRGGNLLIREAYKLTSSKDSKLSQPTFIEIIDKYPPGFKVEIIGSAVKGRHADVIIEYKVSSAFGGMVAVRTGIPLNVDEETNTWKIDFTGETDGQDVAAIKKTDAPPPVKKPEAEGESKK